MLTPEQIAGLPQNVTYLFEQLSEDIMQDMARRVAKTGFLTETTLWQYQRLRELYGKEIYGLVLQKMQVATQKTAPELHNLFLAAGEDAIDFDDIIYRAAGFETDDLRRSQKLMQVLETELAKTNQEFQNLTRTTALGTQQSFISACDRAHLQVMSGAFSYQEAIKIAIHDLAESGAMVKYPTGSRSRLDVATRRCVVTGMNQTVAQMQIARADEFSCNLVETTAHAGARPEHVVWQGKVFSRSGKHSDYPDFVASTGYGTGAGLCGWNCRHNFFPFFEGISTRAYADKFLHEMANATVTYNGEKIPLYDATQLQRTLERKVRAAKRGVIGAESAGLDSKPETAKLRRLQAELRSFTKQTKLSRDYFRERVQEFKSNASRDNFVLPKLPKSGIVKGNKFVPATSIKEAENYAREVLGVPRVSYKGCDLTSANEWNRGLEDSFRRFPKLKENFAFVGECHERNKVMKSQALKCYRDVLKKLNPRAPEDLIERNAVMETNKLMRRFAINKNSMAQSINGGHEITDHVKGVTVNAYFAKDYGRFLESLQQGVTIRFHPTSCDTIRSVLDHEVGHQLDYLLDVSKEKVIQELFDSRTREQLTNDLSTYAWDNDNPSKYSEMVAEAWAEYCNNPTPRDVAEVIGKFIERRYSEL